MAFTKVGKVKNELYGLILRHIAGGVRYGTESSRILAEDFAKDFRRNHPDVWKRENPQSIASLIVIEWDLIQASLSPDKGHRR